MHHEKKRRKYHGKAKTGNLQTGLGKGRYNESVFRAGKKEKFGAGKKNEGKG